jgi:hypothetical protein
MSSLAPPGMQRMASDTEDAERIFAIRTVPDGENRDGHTAAAGRNGAPLLPCIAGMPVLFPFEPAQGYWTVFQFFSRNIPFII